MICIPADYKDADYEGKVSFLSAVLMLKQLASQECVEGSATVTSWLGTDQRRKRKILAGDRLAGEERCMDVEICPPAVRSEFRAPIKMVGTGRCLRRPGVYWTCM
jgi:hypothetical protein